jgi:uncharacterized lipoprotein YmbA
MKTISWPVLAGVAAAILAVGCTALDPQPETTRFFTLSSPSGDTIHSSDGSIQVEIRLNRISDYLQTNRMVIRVSPTELRYSDRYRWAEPLQDAFTRVTADTLREKIPGHASVRVVPIRTAAKGIVTADITLLACEAESPTTAVLEADWQIWEGTAASPASSGHFRRSLPGPSDATFEQLPQLLDELIKQFAANLTEAIEPAIARAEKAETGS